MLNHMNFFQIFQSMNMHFSFRNSTEIFKFLQILVPAICGQFLSIYFKPQFVKKSLSCLLFGYGRISNPLIYHKNIFLLFHSLLLSSMKLYKVRVETQFTNTMISHFLAAVLLVFLPNNSYQEMNAGFRGAGAARGTGYLPITTGSEWKPYPLSLMSRVTSRVLRRSKPRFKNILAKIRYYHLG